MMFFRIFGILIGISLLISQAGAINSSFTVTACDEDDATSSSCLNAINADGGTTHSFTKNKHLDAPFSTLSGVDSVSSATLYFDSYATLTGSWTIRVTDSRDGTTICEDTAAPEDTSETRNSLSCNSITPSQLSSGAWLFVENNALGAQQNVNLEYVYLYISYIESDTTAPSISSETKSPGTITSSDDVLLNATVTDEISIDIVLISGNWSGSWQNITVSTKNGDVYYYNLLSSNLSDDEVVGWRYYANDSSGNLVIGTLQQFTVQSVSNCGNAVCDADETYSSCPQDCCESDGTATDDTICHSACDNYNSASVSSECDSLDASSNICIASNEGYCGSSCTYSACSGTEESCGCSGGSCTAAGSGYYCSSYSLSSCSTSCDNTCSDSACYSYDSDCTSDGNLVSQDSVDATACCGNSLCETAGGEDCSTCSSDCGTCPVNCGDGICDADENKCICPSDCGTCGGDAPGTCKEYSCISAICQTETKTGCCGNSLCDAGETYLTCSSDCSVGTITIDPLLPSENQTVTQGEEIVIKVEVKAGDLAGKNISVYATNLVENVTLYDDGSHGDNIKNDGIYANTAIIPKNTQSGLQIINITAYKNSIIVSKTINVNVSKSLDLSVKTDKKSYENGQEIVITGSANDINNNPIKKGTAEIRFSSGEWTQTVTTDVINGLFNYSYLITFANPEGTWNISVDVQDEYINIGSVLLDKIEISLPSAVALQYNVQILSPTEGFRYKRGEEITIAVKVLDVGENVEGASVSFITPKGDKITLIESTQGVYTRDYKPELDDPIGEWSISVESRKLENGELKLGGRFIVIKIEPVELRLRIKNLAEVISNEDKLKIKTNLTYPDGTPVIGARLNLVAGDELIPLKEISIGQYALTYPMQGKETGVFAFRIEGKDDNSNFVKSDLLNVIVTSKSRSGGVSGSAIADETDIQKMTKLLKSFWWVILIGVIAITFVTRSTSDTQIEGIKKKRKVILETKKEIQRKYFKDGSISQGAYKKLMEEQENKETKLREKEIRIKQETKKKKKGKKNN